METMKWMDSLHPDSPVRQYLRWMNQGGDHELYRTKYESIVREQEGYPEVFLSIVIRTMGNRAEMLQDVLTCLQAQSDGDYEVLIVCHKAGNDVLREVQRTVKAQIPEFAAKVRILPCTGGERGAPLNLGFASARGAYAVCLDDDDLVMDHWVDSFHRAAGEHNGMILHSWVIAQKWQAKTDKRSGRQQLRATGEPSARYCVPFRTLRQQSENYCPFMGLAFPMFLFRKLHHLFDETLTTTEDWDYLLRTAGIAGVWDIPEVTAIYRLWNTGNASRNLVREPEWKENYRQIGGRLMNTPLLLSTQEANECRTEIAGLQSAGQKGRSCFLREAVLFWSDGGAFSDRRHKTAPVTMKDGWIRMQFPLRDECRKERITRLRIDPAEETLFTLESLHVRLEDKGNVIAELGTADIRETNGLQEGDSILFLAEDPRIILEMEEPLAPCTVTVTAQVKYESPAVLSRWAEDLCADARWLAENRNTAHVYLDRGEGWLPSESIACGQVIRGDAYLAEFAIPEELAEGIREIRLDPTEAEMFRLEDPEILLLFADGEEAVRPDQIRWMNGFAAGGNIVFLERDPYLLIPVSGGRTLRQIRIAGKASFIDPEEAEDLFAAATRVPDYALIGGQLRRMRQQQWKEEERRKS